MPYLEAIRQARLEVIEAEREYKKARRKLLRAMERAKKQGISYAKIAEAADVSRQRARQALQDD